ncbi:GNAT family N-acetyltransferase [Amycolatopsis anabasis]|uniref:GNAT family N-acetyltransferase n=1 Tax=Amycolatopsis anabasis TaxID=1840409 RepID=UPI00131C7B47|nr:GNAT family N-acetyltransferase [Amycolatopsis anabasis]
MPSESRPVVRTASVTDAAAIAEIHVLSWQAAYAGHLPGEFLAGLSVDDRRERWAGRLVTGPRPGGVFVVTLEDEVTGFVAVGPSRDTDAVPGTAELHAIYLHPHHWHRGQGRLLHDHALAELADQGFHRVTLWVLRTNALARQFYERAGWSPDGATKTDTIGDRDLPLAEVRYRKPLR